MYNSNNCKPLLTPKIVHSIIIIILAKHMDLLYNNNNYNMIIIIIFIGTYKRAQLKKQYQKDKKDGKGKSHV